LYRRGSEVERWRAAEVQKHRGAGASDTEVQVLVLVVQIWRFAKVQRF